MDERRPKQEVGAVKGFYLSLEGGEGAGKTTVSELLRRLLEARGDVVTIVREPGSTEFGNEVRNLVLHSLEMTPWAEAMLFAAQRAQLVVEVVGPALDRGEVVISDRSLYSSLAYQGGARGLGFEPVRTVNHLAVGGLIPELVVVLGIDLGVGLARQDQPDRIGGEHTEFQARVAQAYAQLAEDEPDRVIVVSAGQGADQVAETILRLIDARRG